MAFSFHIGTKWCHDFPKLAKESGFYFNTHRSKVHIDWNHISSINIDQVIKERDFVTVDENISNIINYNLENQYDIKILDSNFVKVFQLAQLAVEYLLYCKQYLDQSVIILKDELKLKIEDNHKLKKEITNLEDIIQNLKDKVKEKNKIVETKIGDSSGEILKCPHCPKSFISTMFVKAHVARRHPYMTDLSVETSPVHDHYKTETEKLHNEIKMLKERLNQAEKVIRIESDKESSIVKIDNKNKENNSGNDSVNKFELIEKQQIKNNKEISDLKSLLLTEIYNLRHKDESSCKVHDNIPEINVKLLISQQEKEIERLRNQLLDKLTPDIEKMHDKLKSQEEYWKSKIQHMDHQHHMNIEKLTSELKLTQQTAELIKAEYELKVSALEKQSKDQSNILTEQSRQLSSLSCDMKHSQVQTDLSRYDFNTKTEHLSVPTIIQHSKNTHYQDTKIANKIEVNKATTENIDNKLKQKPTLEPVLIEAKISQNCYETKDIDAFRLSEIKNENQIYHKSKFSQKHSKSDSLEEHSNTDSLLSVSNSKTEIVELCLENLNSKNGNINIGNNTLSNSFLSKTASSETLTTSESETESNSEIVTTNNRNSISLNKNRTVLSLPKSTRTSSNNAIFLDKIRKDILEKFQRKLRDIGIDPEWNEIPQVSYKRKMKIIQHHQCINSKKLFKYKEIKSNIIKEILHRISLRSNNMVHQTTSTTVSSLDKLVTNVKSKDEPRKKLCMNVEEDRTTSDIFKDPKKSSILLYKRDAHMTKNVNECGLTDQNKILPNFMNSQKKVTSILSLNVNEEHHKTSTPNQKDSVSFLKSQEVTHLIASPKHNKGALKSATVSVVNSAKKKVFFDLKDNKDKEKSFPEQTELNDSDWNISSISDEKGQALSKRKFLSIDNVTLKTNQTEKITEISKRIEEQLRISRKNSEKVWTDEKLFPGTYTVGNNNKERHENNKNVQHSYLSSISMSNSNSENSSPKLIEKSKSNSTKCPLPTPRSIKNKQFISTELQEALPINNESILEADINDILQED